MPDRDIGIYASSFFLSFEENKNKINAGKNYKIWVQISMVNISLTIFCYNCV